MPSLLVINPNTSTSVSALLQQHVKAAVGAGIDVHTLTARFGAPYIASEASYAVAQHTVLDAWAEKKADFPDYDSGSDGPMAADELLTRGGERAWRSVIPAQENRQ